MTALITAALIQNSIFATAAQDLMAAAKRSAENGKPLVVLVGADWCRACRLMKNEVMPKVAKAGGLKGVEFAYLDVDRDRRLAKRLLRGASIPQMVRFDRTPSGWKSRYLIGARPPEEVRSFLAAKPEKPPMKLSGLRAAERTRE